MWGERGMFNDRIITPLLNFLNNYGYFTYRNKTASLMNNFYSYASGVHRFKIFEKHPTILSTYVFRSQFCLTPVPIPYSFFYSIEFLRKSILNYKQSTYTTFIASFHYSFVRRFLPNGEVVSGNSPRALENDNNTVSKMIFAIFAVQIRQHKFVAMVT